MSMTNTYPPNITISIELNDVSPPFNRLTKVKTYGDNYTHASDILSQYLKHIKDIDVH